MSTMCSFCDRRRRRPSRPRLSPRTLAVQSLFRRRRQSRHVLGAPVTPGWSAARSTVELRHFAECQVVQRDQRQQAITAAGTTEAPHLVSGGRRHVDDDTVEWPTLAVAGGWRRRRATAAADRCAVAVAAAVASRLSAVDERHLRAPPARLPASAAVGVVVAARHSSPASAGR